MEVLTQPFSVKHLLRLLRWPNLLILFFMQAMAALFLSRNMVSIFGPALIWLMLSTILVAAAGNIINDVQDVEIDARNKPHRQVVGRAISRRNALLLYGFISFVGLICGALVNYYVFAINLIALQLLWFYAMWFKCKPFIGNIVVAALMALAVYVVQFAIDVNRDLLLFYTIFAFITGWLREVIKDLEDADGDAACNCNTLAVWAGVKKTKIFAFALSAAGLLLLLFAIVFFWTIQMRLISTYLLLAVLLPWIFLLVKLGVAKNKKQFGSLSLYIKLLMLAGIISMPLIKI